MQELSRCSVCGYKYSFGYQMPLRTSGQATASPTFDPVQWLHWPCCIADIVAKSLFGRKVDFLTTWRSMCKGCFTSDHGVISVKKQQSPMGYRCCRPRWFGRFPTLVGSRIWECHCGFQTKLKGNHRRRIHSTLRIITGFSYINQWPTRLRLSWQAAST